MRALSLAVVVLAQTVSASAIAAASGSDDTLRFFLSKSELVILGEIASDPQGFRTEPGIARYHCNFRITDVLKGSKPAESPIRVIIARFEENREDRLPEMKKGSQCVLFLNESHAREGRRWVS